MRNLLRCRRGATSFAFVLAAIPLIGVFGFATEGAMWYTVKRGAQNAADAAAYSGGLRLACSLATQNGGLACGDAQTVDSRGKQFAAQDGFCTTGFTSLMCRTGTSVAMDIGTYNGTSWASSASGADVKATVTQTQPMYFVSIFKPLLGPLCTADGCSFSINAQAVARVGNPKPICALGLGRRSSSHSGLTISGNFTNAGTGCALMSDNTVKYASPPTFTGTGWAVDAVNGCTNSGSCNPGVPYDYYMPPATNPVAALDTQPFNSITGSASACGKKTITNSDPPCLIAPTPLGGPAYSDLTVNSGSVTFAPTAANSTFIFYNATLNFNGGTITAQGVPAPSTPSGVNIVLLGNSSLTINGATVTLSANFSNTTYPALNGVLIDDQAPNASKNNVNISGGGTSKLGGVMYFPNVDVGYGGTAASTLTTCTEVIANTITLGGGAYLNSQNCAPGTVDQTQTVTLVY